MPQPIKPVAIITIGLPGCGKSTFARILCGLDPRYVQVERDLARIQLLGDVRDHSDEEAVTALCYQQIRDAAQAGQSVVISDTNLNTRFRIGLATFLEALGYRVTGLVFMTPLRECQNRNHRRPNPVPYVAMISMSEEFDRQNATGVFIAGLDAIQEWEG